MIAPTSTALSLLWSLSVALSSVEDPVRASLQATADHFSNLVSWSTVTVALGVSLEGVEILHAIVTWRKRKRREKREDIELRELADNFPCGKAKCETKSHSEDPKWAKLLLRVGIILVVIGVVGEWRFGTELEDAHNAIHRYDLEKLIETERLAGVAATSAKIANEEAGKAHIAASDALTLSRGARQEADSFEKDIVSAKRQAAEAESHLADALQRAAEADSRAANTERKIADRHISQAQQERIRHSLSKWDGMDIRFPITMVNGDDETWTYAGELLDTLCAVPGWSAELSSVNNNSGASDLAVTVQEDAPTPDKSLARDLVTALHDVGIEAKGPEPPPRVGGMGGGRFRACGKLNPQHPTVDPSHPFNVKVEIQISRRL